MIAALIIISLANAAVVFSAAALAARCDSLLADLFTNQQNQNTKEFNGLIQ